MRGTIVVAVSMSAAIWVHRANAWGEDGHKIICAIANDLLTGRQRSEVQRLVGLYRPGGGTPYRYFTAACTFADLARAYSQDFSRAAAQRNRALPDGLKVWARFAEFENWHFLNVSRRAQHATLSDCHDDCVLKGIARHRDRLANKQLKDWERAEALIFLGHWVGDIHQPLHVSYGDDRGGSRIDRIKGGYYASPNLHAVWDSGIIKKARGREDWLAYKKTLMNIQASERSAWEKSSPLDWANESYAITVEDDTDYCELRRGTCGSEGKTRTLTERYQKRFQPVVEVRLRQASVRLARLIADAIE